MVLMILLEASSSGTELQSPSLYWPPSSSSSESSVSFSSSDSRSREDEDDVVSPAEAGDVAPADAGDGAPAEARGRDEERGGDLI